MHLELRISSKFFDEMAVMVYSGAWGKLNHEKYLKSKISGSCPFKSNVFAQPYNSNSTILIFCYVKYPTLTYIAALFLAIDTNLSSKVLFGHNANVVVFLYSVPILVHWEQPLLKTDLNVLLIRQELL